MGDTASRSGLSPSVEPASAVSPADAASIPIADFAHFLRIYERLWQFEAQQRFIRRWGAFSAEEIAQFPDPRCLRVVAWMRDAQGIEAEGGDAESGSVHESPVATSGSDAPISPSEGEDPPRERSGEPMKIWFDTEFIEDGKTIDLISIGLIREDGERFYAEAAECDLSRASPWVRENVLPHLTGRTMPRAEIAVELIAFAGQKPEFWAYYADYDWVALCQLCGTMMDLPKGWPMYCRDVKQLADSLGNPKLPTQKTTEHNALLDAVWCAEAWEFLQDTGVSGRTERQRENRSTP